LLGFPYQDAELLKEWCGHRVLLSYGRLGVAEQVDAAHAMVAFWRYVEAFVAARERLPGDDLTTDLLALAHAEPDQLDREDIPTLVFSIALAGHETTTSGIGNALYQLLSHRDQWDRLRREPNRVGTAVEEALRHDSPLIAWRRTARHETKVGDITVPAGARLLLFVASAHRDPARFAEPDRLDIARSNARDHMAFGSLTHYCLGAPLARFEMRVAIEALLREAPDIRLCGPAPEHVANSSFRCLTSLLAEPRPAA
jgi:cytochrome P450